MLRFERIFNGYLIPEYLINQVKPGWIQEKFYNALSKAEENGNILLYGLFNEERELKGFLWATASPVDKCIYGNILSVDRLYQNNGTYIHEAIKELKQVRKILEFTGIKWVTTRPKAFERYGFKRSKAVLMEE